MYGLLGKVKEWIQVLQEMNYPEKFLGKKEKTARRTDRHLNRHTQR